jgi:hypothetical protein
VSRDLGIKFLILKDFLAGGPMTFLSFILVKGLISCLLKLTLKRSFGLDFSGNLGDLNGGDSPNCEIFNAFFFFGD